MQHWYALYTKPHAERQVAGILCQRNIEAYFPTTPAPRRKGRSPVRAFFPCYLFARADLQVIGEWALRYMPGVRGLVMLGGIPAVVDDRVVEQIRERLAHMDPSGSGKAWVDQKGELVEPGDLVKITAGPFVDLDAVFDRRLSPQGRVRVFIGLLDRWGKSDRWRKVELDADALRRISAGAPQPNLTKLL